MRLILIVPNFPKLSESFIVSKFLGLLELGLDVYIVCGSSDPVQWRNFPELEKHPEARRRVKVNWPHRPRWLASLLAPLSVFWCLCRNPTGTVRYLRRGARPYGVGVLRRLYLEAMVVALKPDLVHFEFGALAVERMRLKELLNCKIIVSFRGYDLNLCGLDDPEYYREVWAHADAVHLLGEGLWKGAQRRGCPSTKPHVLIPPAIDTVTFVPGESRQDETGRACPLRILSVGRITWEKGYEYALQAMRLLMDQGIHCELRIVGDGAMFEALAFARHQLGVKDCVHFLGALSNAQVREEMRVADVLLHAAVSEGFSNAVLEAQAMGLPIVSSDAGGLPENVANGETGFVVSHRDPAALAEKLAVLSSDVALRTQMGLAGRDRVLNHFRAQDKIAAFHRFYVETFKSA